jgi:hypothetical protein
VGLNTPDASDTLETFKLADGIFVLGSFEKGLTVRSQQVRAHNLAWALREQGLAQNRKNRVAIVGGGIAALTLAAGLAATCDGIEISIFEKRAHLCPFQLGCDTRWLHPRLYEWPQQGSRAPSSQLPIFNWQAGRASDVAHSILRWFERGKAALQGDPLEIYLSVEHLVIDAKTRNIEWIGRNSVRTNFSSKVEGQRRQFDVIVLATGFGVEDLAGDSATPSYWRNESYGQPILDGMSHVYGISGYGDGALIDLARLTIDRYRQDRIITELFGDDESVDRKIADEINRMGVGDNIHDLLYDLESTHFAGKVDLIRSRLRTDTRVGIYLGGKDNKNKSFRDVFTGKVSFVNRLLFYCLFRSGAFVPIFDDLEKWASSNGVANERRIIRHGTNAEEHVSKIFSESTSLKAGIAGLIQSQAQRPDPIYPLNSFPLFGV